MLLSIEAINCSIKTTKTDQKLKLYKYYIHTLKIKKLHKNDKCIQQNFKT